MSYAALHPARSPLRNLAYVGSLAAGLALTPLLPAVAGAQPPRVIVPGQATTAAVQLAPTAMHFRNCCIINTIAAADLNGDGFVDIVSGNGQSYDFTVLINDGAGGFAEPVSHPLDIAVTGFVAVATGDVNGDGHQDILVAGHDDFNIQLFTGIGDGTFAAPATFGIGNGLTPRAVALVDVNGDGKFDVVSANSNSNDISVLLGDGAGGFSAAATFAVGAIPDALSVADVNGDGYADVVTANPLSQNLSLLVGDGTGQFGAATLLSVGPDAEPSAVVIADATGDGHADIVTANKGQDGSGLPPPSLPGSVSVLAGDGAGAFAAALQLPLGPVSGRAQGLAVGDVTGDGRADIAVSRPFANGVSVLASDGVGGFAAPAYRPTSIEPVVLALADVTGDSHPDVVVGNAYQMSISVLPSDGAGKIGFDGHLAAGADPNTVLAGDFDGDGRADIAVTNMTGNDISVFLNSGAGTFAPEVRHAVGTTPTKIIRGDVNEDGHTDLVVANWGRGDVSVLFGDGAGGFAPASTFSVQFTGDETPYSVALGDVNNDGHLDIVTANWNFVNESISLLLGTGNGGFNLQAPTLSPGTQGPYHLEDITLVDVNGDGNADIVTANYAANNLSLLMGDGAGHFAAVTNIATDLAPVQVAAGDVNGDGRVDLVTLNTTAHDVSVLLGNGAGGFFAAQNYPIYPIFTVNEYNAWAWGLALGDVNGDGYPDIVTADSNSETVSVLTNDSSGGFAALAWFDTGSQPLSVAVADFDGDGQADVVSANRRNNDVSVLFNRSAPSDVIFANGFEGVP